MEVSVHGEVVRLTNDVRTALDGQVCLMWILSPAFLSGFCCLCRLRSLTYGVLYHNNVLDRASESLKMCPREPDVSDLNAHMHGLTPSGSCLVLFPLWQPMWSTPACVTHPRASRPRTQTGLRVASQQ